MGKTRLMSLGMAVVMCALYFPCGVAASEVKESNYRGWKTLELTNGLIDVQVAPDIGGRIIQFKLGDFEYLWVNDQLAGKMPPPTGVGPKGEWLNYGGDKLWPAPQGWSGENEWPGPPGPAIEGTPHEGSIVTAKGKTVAVQLISPKDKSTGIQFSRTINLWDGASGVRMHFVMRNIDKKPRRWGIWQVTQINCGDRQGSGYDKNIWAYCPINPKSIFPKGFKVLFGSAANPAFQPDPDKKMVRVHYERQVGKIAMDSMAGWLAVVSGDGHAFVERFKCFPDKKYPNDASVEFWLQGPGKFTAAGKENEIADNPVDAPPYLEAEVLSPLAELKPGKTYLFSNEWFATNLGGKFSVLDCTEVGVMSEPFTAKMDGESLLLAGRFGVFYEGYLILAFLDEKGKQIKLSVLNVPTTPAKPLVLSADPKLTSRIKVPPNAATVVLNSAGGPYAELARATIQR